MRVPLAMVTTRSSFSMTRCAIGKISTTNPITRGSKKTNSVVTEVTKTGLVDPTTGLVDTTTAVVEEDIDVVITTDRNRNIIQIRAEFGSHLFPPPPSPPSFARICWLIFFRRTVVVISPLTTIMIHSPCLNLCFQCLLRDHVNHN